jgi:hypothetical protein
MLTARPSKELIEIGYDSNKMLFFTQDGGISQEVWDVVLYSRLERKPELENDKLAFYQAHIQGDQDTKSAIHNKYLPQTCAALKRHVEYVLSEVAELSVKMNTYDASKHPRLPLLKKHNQMVVDTFQRVKNNLDQISADVMV